MSAQLGLTNQESFSKNPCSTDIMLSQMTSSTQVTMDPGRGLQAAFQAFDPSGRGYIPAGELRRVLLTVGEAMSEGEVEELLRAADSKCDGHIDYTENLLDKTNMVDATLSEEQIAEYRQAFSLYDKNQEGCISCDKLGAVLKSLGQKAKDSEIQEFVAEIDINGDGQIDFHEFLIMMARLSYHSDDRDLKAAFDVFDTHGDGKIAYEDLTQVLRDMGETTTSRDITALLQEADRDRDGRINYHGAVNVDSKFSEEQIAEYHLAFGMFDRDMDGSISSRELGVALRCLGQFPRDNELQELVHSIDADGDGKIDFPEFLTMVAQRTDKEDDAQLKQAFSVFDKDGDGKISAAALGKVLTHLGDEMSEAEVRALLREADMDGDGLINYSEFVEMVTK